MDRVGREAGERMELRGITPEQVIAGDPEAVRQFWDIATDVAEDMIAKEVLYGGMSNGGHFTGLMPPGAGTTPGQPGA